MNDTIFFFFYNFSHQSNFFDHVIIFFSVYFPYVVVFLAGVFIVMHNEVFKSKEPFKIFMQKKKEILTVFLSGIIAWFLAYILKIFFHAPRPFDVFPQVHSLFSETGYAFPSGHSTFFMALAVSIFLLHKKAGYIFICFALLVGLARIIAGVHFPIDILAGFLIGFSVSYILSIFHPKIL